MDKDKKQIEIEKQIEEINKDKPDKQSKEDIELSDEELYEKDQESFFDKDDEIIEVNWD